MLNSRVLNKEMEIFKVAYDELLKHISVLDNVGECKEIYGAAAGSEGWFQFVVLDALLRKGYSIVMKGKVKRHCDIIVNDVGIELRTELRKTQNPYWFVNCLRVHPKADCYMFLTRTMLKERLLKYLEENGYAEMHKELNSRWMLWLVKKVS